MISLSGFGYEETLKNPIKVFANTWKSKSFINGPTVKEFEKKFAEYCEADSCVALSSCTSALHLSLLALGVGPGDEVITVPYTWVSTAEVIKQVGAIPVFVDIALNDMCIDPKEVTKKISKKTKAIIGVDLYGNVCDIDELKKFNIPVIQDSAQSTGAYYKGKRVGSVADLTCFSFYPTKNLSCWGDAGAVTGNEKYLKIIRQLRNHGQSDRFKMNMVGWNARMDSIQAEVLLNKLPELDKHNARRRAIATQYNGNLHGVVEIPVQNVNSTHVYHQYIIKHEKNINIEKFLLRQGIQSRRYYPIPLHKTETYKNKNSYPNAEYCSGSALAIPVHQYLTDREVSSIIKAIKEAI
jgi:dTDP-4-amino-4,6-dideoxygalactose transaminase